MNIKRLCCLALCGALLCPTALAAEDAMHSDYHDYMLAEPNYPALTGEWYTDQTARDEIAVDADGMVDFALSSAQAILTDGAYNGLYSPVNLYLCLHMMRGITSGATQAQIDQVIGDGSAKGVFTSLYQSDDFGTCLPAAALWLGQGVSVTPEAQDELVNGDGAWIFQGPMDGEGYNAAMRMWLNERTNDLLKSSVDELKFDPQASLSLAATLYFKAGWMNPFSEYATQDAPFHTASGDVTVPFMHQSHFGTVYEGVNFTAVALPMMGGQQALFLLPAEGVDPRDLLADGQARQFLMLGANYENGQEGLINLAVPKLDMTCAQSIKDAMATLGITEAFDPAVGDFSGALVSSEPIVLGDMLSISRLIMNEDGVEAAAITMTGVLGGMMVPQEIIDFTLDRPFLYAVMSSGNLPLFLGVTDCP